MQRDIFESMAEGVEGAACIVAFLSQQYRESATASRALSGCNSRAVFV